MRLKEKLWQRRFDFNGVFECEFCGKHQLHQYCYDDDNFFSNVIPAIRCASCNKRTDDSLPEEREHEKIPVVQIEQTILTWVNEDPSRR
jgi:transcription elongation factor Elf1